MTIDRALWKWKFSNWPVWPCPSCGGGNLSLVKMSLTIIETGPSKSAHSEDAWEFSWIDERFTAQLLCGNADCGNNVAVCGRARKDDYMYYDNEGHTQIELVPEFMPLFFCDAPPVFSIAEECPETVENELKKAFSLLWSDVGSAANRVRSGVEALLNDRGVVRKIKEKGKSRILPLHSRIKKFEAKNAEAANSLLAIKWLGNEGSHVNVKGIETDDLLDAFELFEHVIDLVYVKRATKLKRLAAGINKRRGSMRRRKKIKPLF